MSFEESLSFIFQEECQASLMAFCDGVSASYEYSRERLPEASLCRYALMLAARTLTSGDERQEALKSSYLYEGPLIDPVPDKVVEEAALALAGGGASVGDTAAAMGLICYKAVVNESEPAEAFCRLFVHSWCQYHSMRVTL